MDYYAGNRKLLHHRPRVQNPFWGWTSLSSVWCIHVKLPVYLIKKSQNILMIAPLLLYFLFLQAQSKSKATKTVLWGSQFCMYINAIYSGLHLHFSYCSGYFLDPQKAWEGDKEVIFYPAAILEIPRSVNCNYVGIFDQAGISFGKWRGTGLWITVLG